ncbi:MAG: protein phosphatase 2C domain-containing protein [Abditibacteriales bacterium]|nr:protein phosphatase 2C domain-containing protein [Abditibacteriales bacterium]MDW8368255.1 protein phosphatase 2C domain-containing protein [Abditibacteriales bacterium]
MTETPKLTEAAESAENPEPQCSCVLLLDTSGSLPQCVVCSETNQRENNEDSFQVFSFVPAIGQSPVVVLAVADGMGGHAYGEHVSREALRKVSLSLFEQLTVEPSLNCLNILPPLDEERLAQALLSALEQANAQVQRMVKANQWGKAGSTIVVAAILHNTAVVANLGDSPLFHYQACSGQLRKVTQDHTVADVLLRAGMITPEMARYHEGRSQLEFYLGGATLPKEPPVYHVALAPGDLLLLCTDGVTGSLLHEQVAAILTESRDDLKGMAERLIQASRQAGETDNQTLILWRHDAKEQSRPGDEPTAKEKSPASAEGKPVEEV